MSTEPIGKVQAYLAKHSSNPLPSPDTSRIKLEGGKPRIKGSKLDEWRVRGALGGTCTCGVTVTRLTVDHIVPVSFIANLDNAFEIATNDEDNFQLLCELCNRKKSGVIDMRNPKTAPLLAKYIAPYL